MILVVTILEHFVLYRVLEYVLILSVCSNCVLILLVCSNFGACFNFGVCSKMLQVLILDYVLVLSTISYIMVNSFKLCYSINIIVSVRTSRLLWTSPDLYYFFVEIMSDEVILDHNKPYLVYFVNFHFL